MRFNTCLAVICLLLLVAPTTVLARDALVGTWKIKVTPSEDARNAGEKEIDDKVTFKGAKFVSEAWKKNHKFEAVAYEEDSRSAVIAKFTAKPVSKTAGKMEWTGTATGNQITGEITWTKADGTELTYAFEGEKE